MMIKPCRLILVLSMFCQGLSCSSSDLNIVSNPVSADAAKLDTARRHFFTAKSLEERGLHLEASIYFEAALDGGIREEEILPMLVVSLVRAGRLEAAKENIERLAQIAPENSTVIELQGLLISLTQGSSNNSTGVVR